MKIVKFFVVFNLILSVSLINSVAAISVSDGSAFVTKAEFAADLNNLSNRMSTLENSLDVKIDSLVSSYLSRNGIWNGEKQECEKVPTSKVGLKWTNNSMYGWVFNQGLPTSTGNLLSNAVYVSTSHRYIPDVSSTLSSVIISKVTKSGLCNLIINFSNTTYAFATFLNFEGSGSGGYNVHGDHWGSAFTQEYSVYAGGNLSYYDSFNFNMPTHSYYQLNYKTKINCYFFVQKEQEVKLEIKPTIRNGQTMVKYTRGDDMGCSISSWQASIY